VAASRPDLVRAMCEGNRNALLEAVDDALGRLGAARGSLASTGALAATLQAGHLARRDFDAARDEARENTMYVELSHPGAFEQLREIGRDGGRVVAVEGTGCQVELCSRFGCRKVTVGT
jgi:prephenate dehydrogenase